MKFIEKIYNSDNLTLDDIEETTTRARAIIINSQAQILLCYSNELAHYEFPGGHLEENETLIEGLKREVLEETGIKLKNKDIQPFYVIKYYCKNYLGTKNNRLVEIYYFIVKTNQHYNLNKLKLDKQEITEKYECVYISVKELKNILLENKKTTKESNTALDDMLLVWNEYIRKFNGELYGGL